ncbi:OLC1v1030779C1 [Oldenlandia corymbosa var. corymbosa]|uniref:OLC1v1030779C1 n=1 Tax=Oldenlandia corymbosa var. corymbosa TaxID=529605 RepID=A0AAV1CHY5_OLDCO|nr:OLC1v1030779C1 [Oldenlandia corymbosa var. corymbosa]
MSLPQSSATAHSAGQGSIPNQTSASGWSSLPMNTLPNISTVDSYSTVITDQSTGIGRQSSQQQSNVGSKIEHVVATQVERFENAFQRLTDHNANRGSAGPSRSMTSGVNTATGAASSEVPPVSMPAFVSPPGNFTFDGQQLPPLSPQYGTPVMRLGTSWGQQSPYQGFQAPWPVTPGMQQQVLPMQHQQGSTAVLSQLSGQEGVPRLTYIPQGITDVGVQGAAGVTINQGPVGTGNNQGAVGKNARQAGQHVQATNDRRFILYHNRVSGNNTAAANLDDPHIPQGSGVVVADPQITLKAEDAFSRMIEYKICKELGTEIPEIPGKPYPDYVEWEPLPWNFKIPDFQQFSGEDEKRPEDHINKYDEPTIVKMANAGIQDYKVKLAVAPHSVRSLNHLADIVRRCEKVIKDKREKNPGKTKQWFNKAPLAEVNQSQWVHDEDDDEYEVNAAEIVNVRNYTCDALRRPTVPHSYNTPPPVGAPAGTPGQAGGANIGRVYSFDISQQEAIFDDMFQKGHIQYRRGYRQPKPLDLVGKIVYNIKVCIQKFFRRNNECPSIQDMGIPFSALGLTRHIKFIIEDHQCSNGFSIPAKGTIQSPEPATATTIIPKAAADTLAVPEVTSIVTKAHDATVGGIQLLSQEGKGPIIILSPPAESSGTHIRPLYICAIMNGVPLRRVLVDNGAAINILPTRALQRLGKQLKDLVPTEAKEKQAAIKRVLQYFENKHQHQIEMPMVCWDEVIYDADPVSDSDVIDLNELATATPKLSDEAVVTKEPVEAAEYEGLIHALEMLIYNGATHGKVIGDSALVFGQMKKLMKRSDEVMAKYAAVDMLAVRFQHIEFYNVERDFNAEANDMAQLASRYLKVPLGPDIASRFRYPCLIPSFQIEQQSPLDSADYATAMLIDHDKLAHCRNIAAANIIHQKIEIIWAYNKFVRYKRFNIGAMVSKAILPLGHKDRVYGKCSGPYIIHQHLGQGVYVLKDLDGTIADRSIKASYLHKYFDTTWHQLSTEELQLARDIAAKRYQ